MAALPTEPARFAHMLISPIETAAADAVKVSVGSAQNGAGQKLAANPVRQSQPITTGNGWWGIALPASKRAVAAWPATQCHLRSPLRSEDRPAARTLISPQA